MPEFLNIKNPDTRVVFGRAMMRTLLALAFPAVLAAQYQKAPPDFGDTYSFPSPVHPEPIADWMRLLDVGLLALALGAAAWLILKSRNRKGVVLLSICSVVYFGFYRKGCVCSVGSIQNVVLCLVDPRYAISFSVIALFFLPLVATLFFGRVFCGGVCPLGALQELVVLRPVRVPLKLDKALRSLQFVYLGLAVLFAGWGLQLKYGWLNINIAQRFLVCEWDPIIPIFRRSGPFYMVAIAAAFILAGMFIGRPYCRWLCPYGGILSLLSRVAWKNVRITPDKELDCGKCEDACPYGAILSLRADRGLCMACTRCYEYCPRQKRLVALKAGPQPKRVPASAAVPPRRWEAVARTWIGILSVVVLAATAALMLTFYVRAERVMTAEKALVESLIEKAKTDAEVQKTLQPELNRQHEAGVVRRRVYDTGGWILIIAAAILIAWFARFRPKHGMGAGAPGRILKFIESPPDRRR